MLRRPTSFQQLCAQAKFVEMSDPMACSDISDDDEEEKEEYEDSEEQQQQQQQQDNEDSERTCLDNDGTIHELPSASRLAINKRLYAAS